MSRYAGLLALVIFFAASTAQANAQEGVRYSLLELNGMDVKWGAPEPGTGASVTIAIADRRFEFPSARNCRTVVEPDALLATSGISRGEFETALKEAVSAWEAVAGIRFRILTDPYGADIVVGADVSRRDWAFASIIPADAQGGPSLSIERAAICFNPDRAWKIGFDGQLGIYDLKFVMMHEIGHAIGLDHGVRSGAVMGYVYDESVSKLQSSDIAGARALYGPPDAPADLAYDPATKGDADVSGKGRKNAISASAPNPDLRLPK